MMNQEHKSTGRGTQHGDGLGQLKPPSSPGTAHPKVVFTDEHMRPFGHGTSITKTVIPQFIRSAVASNPGRTVEIILPESLVERFGYGGSPPMIFVNKDSRPADIAARVMKGHKKIGPGPISFEDVAREIKEKLSSFSREAPLNVAAATKFARLLNTFLRNPRVQLADCRQLVVALDNLYEKQPHFSAKEYLQKGTGVRPELGKWEQQETLSLRIHRAGHYLKENLELLGKKVRTPRDDRRDSLYKDLDRRIAEAKVQMRKHYEANRIPKAQAVAEYRELVAKTVADFRKANHGFKGSMLSHIEGLVEGARTQDTFQGAERLAYILQRACEYSNFSADEMKAIRDGKGEKILAKILLADWAKEKAYELLDAGRKIQYAK